MSLSKRVRIFILKTQGVREDLALSLQKWISKAESEVEKAEDPKVRSEWLRLAGFLTQVLNSVMRIYDEVRFNEDIQQLSEMIKEAEEIRERLKEKERELENLELRLKMKEDELRRKEIALENMGKNLGNRQS